MGLKYNDRYIRLLSNLEAEAFSRFRVDQITTSPVPKRLTVHVTVFNIRVFFCSHYI